MTTAIIGLGNMGKGLAKRLAGKTDLFLSSRNPGAASALAAGLTGARSGELTRPSAPPISSSSHSLWRRPGDCRT